MALKFEELRILKAAEAVADGIWRQVVRWDRFARDVVGGQMARAADSIGANIAEAYGRFHFGEKLQFLYYARGSLFETKYWLNRARKRSLMPPAQVEDYASQLTDLARQLNAFATTLRAQRKTSRSQPKAIGEPTTEYVTAWPADFPLPLFSEEDLEWLQTINTQYPIPNIQYPISNTQYPNSKEEDMNREQFIKTMDEAKLYDLTQGCSIFTPPWPGEKSLEVHFFKRVTGAYGGGLGANGQFIRWSNTVGTHLVGERAFHSGARAIADIPLKDLCGPGVVVDISDLVSDYSLYTPEMIKSRATVKEGDILIINTGYHRYSWDMPDVFNPLAQGGVESKEFGFLVRHPGPSPDFFPWALDMKLKVVGVDCGCAEHPMNTPIRYMHAGEFEKAEAKLVAEYGKTWDEMFPPDDYYTMTHITMPKAHLLLAESIVGDINELNNQRAWVMIHPIPYMEVGTAWSRVVALQSPAEMDETEFFQIMDSAEMIDMTLPFSVQTPQWANYEPLSIKYTKRVGGQAFGMGRNGALCAASFHLATHMDGEKHFWPAGRTIGEVPLEEWVGPGVIADISHLVSDASVYTPAMIESVVDVHQGDILLIKTGWHKYGWNSPNSDEFRYMIKHPGPSPDFSQWCVDKKIKWIGVDAVSADHPMNTIQRIWHPKTFEEANRKLIEAFGKDWDEMYPLDEYYQDMHLNLFPKKIVHAENLGKDIANAPSGRYYIGCYMQKGMETASMWGRFVAFKEGG